jgi:Calcineurin-like phosphoesterase
MSVRIPGSRVVAVGAVAALLALLALALGISSPASAAAAQLTRYPYLTDVVSAGSTDNAAANFGTDQTVTAAFATVGPAGGSCTGTTRTGSKTSITVNGVAEFQWKVKFTGLSPGASFCYRLFAGTPTAPGADLLGSDASPVFTTPPAPGSGASFKFAVFGDMGATNSSGTNPDQANLDQQIAASGALFAMTTGDTAYPSGSQTNYGDLFQTGPNISDVFAPNFFKNIGDSISMYPALGNHGVNATFLNIWPQPTAPSLSGGRYQMDTYCCVNGTKSVSYPSAWYAFSVGRARFYVLDATWPNGNLGTGSLFSNDYASHWTASSPEYMWLSNDLAAHPGGLKFAVMHFPMYSDNATETTDTYLHSGGTSLTDQPGSVASLLSQNGVQVVFNGHAHIYERNTQQPGETFVSYVSGGGGAPLEPVSGCHSFDAYAIGWSPTKSVGSRCGAATAPSSASQVYHYLLVTVDSSTVTVAPTDEMGRTFDVHTYSF